MEMILAELEEHALHLSPEERGQLIHRLIVSLEGTPEDTPRHRPGLGRRDRPACGGNRFRQSGVDSP